MGEKQIEVGKRILRTQIGVLKKELESVRKHRRQYCNCRVFVPIPVVSLVGYTIAGKSTLLYRLTGANVLADDRLFATLDPTTIRVQVDKASDPDKLKVKANEREDVICVSALTGDGLQDFCD
ncbi:hypothetical protein IFM89_039143 [Coptis chinensis]|uniref:Hflx-type G domain-containing protein n=1 Tax=Coptis chinensis TaxID=261450 RepID=A0A835H0L4_9MAGN|nr:hypothetical protein IFM89_039143 [Coptis chinensis]